MTTTDNHIQEDYQLPNVLPVNVGVISIPTRIHVDSLSEFEELNREVTHLLALLPDEDKHQAELDEDEFHIHTTNVPALKYATNNYFLDDVLTTCHAVHEAIDKQFDGEVCCDCIDRYIDEALDNNYTSVVLEGGVFLKRGTL